MADRDGAPSCPLRDTCRLPGALRRARRALYESLDPPTVHDLVASPTGPALRGPGTKPS